MITKTWEQFLEELDEYLYRDGWYVNGERIKERIEDGRIEEENYQQIIDYLSNHCYDHEDAVDLVESLQ